MVIQCVRPLGEMVASLEVKNDALRRVCAAQNAWILQAKSEKRATEDVEAMTDEKLARQKERTDREIESRKESRVPQAGACAICCCCSATMAPAWRCACRRGPPPVCKTCTTKVHACPWCRVALHPS